MVKWFVYSKSFRNLSSICCCIIDIAHRIRIIRKHQKINIFINIWNFIKVSRFWYERLIPNEGLKIWLLAIYKLSFYQKIYSLTISIFQFFQMDFLLLTSPSTKIITPWRRSYRNLLAREVCSICLIRERKW